MKVGIVGIAGEFGRWFKHFFIRHYRAEVFGNDPNDPHSLPLATLVASADILLFCTPTRLTESIIKQCVQLAHGCEQHALWMDITSIKFAPVKAMMTSKANVLGLHPMCAAPTGADMRGKVLVVDKARLTTWSDWVTAFLRDLQAECIACDAQTHDQCMAFVQGVVHANHLAQEINQTQLFSDEQLWRLRSPSFALTQAIIGRIRCSNAKIYEDIQFDNPYVLPALQAQRDELERMIQWIQSGDESDREQWRKRYFIDHENDRALRQQTHHLFEHLANLVGDCSEPNDVSIRLLNDEPGILRKVLQVFEAHQLNLRSIHSSRNVQGNVVFRLGLDVSAQDVRVQQALSELAKAQWIEPCEL